LNGADKICRANQGRSGKLSEIGEERKGQRSRRGPIGGYGYCSTGSPPGPLEGVAGNEPGHVKRASIVGRGSEMQGSKIGLTHPNLNPEGLRKTGEGRL